jgi:hypothetical protein
MNDIKIHRHKNKNKYKIVMNDIGKKEKERASKKLKKM